MKNNLKIHKNVWNFSPGLHGFIYYFKFKLKKELKKKKQFMK